MDKIKKNFGFGCMRFPMIGEEIDEAQVSQMVDYFLDQGFNYFDTAHGYIGERSELAVKNCLTSRYPRESYILTNKTRSIQCNCVRTCHNRLFPCRRIIN